ncbi:MAG: hypothetical protein ABWY06_18325 [Pseudomonas sp.]|uniref:hypothetical protein n=1 Tax=Pseudomonas sp. TaxID=306 RepID=UPI0033947B88
MQCPKCQQACPPHSLECPHCGIIFAKYRLFMERQASSGVEHAEDSRWRRMWRCLLTPPPARAGFWHGRALLWALFVLWGGSYLLRDIDSLANSPGFLHNVDLVFHEAGHVLFGFFGKFIGSLGGTLGQLLMPVVCAVALLRHNRDTFAASLCLWWTGQNLLDIAPYMADARAGQLPLLGGNFGHSSPYGFHDWEYLLGETGLLAYDQGLARACLYLGRLVMFASLLWGAYLLWKGRPGNGNQQPEA